MMRTSAWAFLASICTLTLWMSAANAQHASLQGGYTLDPAASDSIEAAIEQSIAPMNFIVRPIARSRLVKTNPRYQRIAISHNDTTTSVQFDARKPIEMPADGHAVPWIREDGEKFEVSAQWSATQLVMHFKAEDGERVNTFVLEPEGKTLKLNVKLVSARLPAPVTYVLTYHHEAS
jgi:hypothetical protein